MPLDLVKTMSETTNNQNDNDAATLITAATRRRLELIEKYSDQISGLRSEIADHSFDVLKYGGHEILRECEKIHESTLQIARILIKNQIK